MKSVGEAVVRSLPVWVVWYNCVRLHAKIGTHSEGVAYTRAEKGTEVD